MPMTKRIIIEGPESSGKTTLASYISAATHAALISETARAYLTNLNRAYNLEDIYKIASLYEEATTMATATPLVVCDTGYLNLIIWLEDKFGITDKELIGKWQLQSSQGITLLCRPDIAWEPDSLREDPHRRDYLFALYQKKCADAKLQYIVIEGNREEALPSILRRLRLHF
jgi:nicotinamide riboside kinase